MGFCLRNGSNNEKSITGIKLGSGSRQRNDEMAFCVFFWSGIFSRRGVLKERKEMENAGYELSWFSQYGRESESDFWP